MKTKKLVTTAMLLALAVILSLVKVFELPFGGSVTLVSMMPIVLISYIYGVKWGIGAAFIYSVLQILTGMNVVSAFFLPGDSQMAVPAAMGVCLFDYVLAYGALGFGGIFKNKFRNRTTELVLGTITALLLRYVMHIISGAIFFGTWAEWFFADSTGLARIAFFKPFCDFVMGSMKGVGLALFYSVVYNGAYMIPEIIITVIVTPIIYKVMVLSKLVKE